MSAKKAKAKLGGARRGGGGAVWVGRPRPQIYKTEASFLCLGRSAQRLTATTKTQHEETRTRTRAHCELPNIKCAALTASHTAPVQHSSAVPGRAHARIYHTHSGSHLASRPRLSAVVRRPPILDAWRARLAASPSRRRRARGLGHEALPFRACRFRGGDGGGRGPRRGGARHLNATARRGRRGAAGAKRRRCRTPPSTSG